MQLKQAQDRQTRTHMGMQPARGNLPSIDSQALTRLPAALTSAFRNLMREPHVELNQRILTVIAC
jgi:hypothetical protein